MDKEKELKAEEFFLKKQWEELEEQRKVGSSEKIPASSGVTEREIMKKKPIFATNENESGNKVDEKKKL